MSTILKRAALLGCIAITGFSAQAQQVYPYFVDFEIDSTKAYADATPVLLNGIDWAMPGVYLGDMVPASDKFNGLHAARVRRTDNTTGDNGSLTMEEDLSEGIGSITFSHGRYGSESGSTLQVFYSTNQGGNWTQAGSTITVANTLTSVTIPINVSSPARISIRKADTSASRINVDDIMITGYNGFTTNVVVVNKAPIGSDVPLTTNNLTFKFNEAVDKGASGNIVLHNKTDNTNQTIAVTSASVSVSGQDVTVNGISLLSNKDYFVTFDSAAFVKSAGVIKSTGIYADNIWKFTTVDTTTPPNITSLNETFADCNDPLMGVFKHTSVTGTQTWRCGTQGHTGNNSVYINGGFSGGANDNEDWLITNAPVDLAAVNNPSLEFWFKMRYSGTTTKDVLVSTNYTGSGNPSTATWQSIRDISPETATEWTQVSNISLNAYKTTPFYLAFKYQSAAANGGAQEWSLDDIKITAGTNTGINGSKKDQIGLYVLGQATTSRIVLGIKLDGKAETNIAVYDVNGRKVFNANTVLETGSNTYTIDNAGLTPGLYVIRVNDGKYNGIVKAVVQ